MLKILQARLQQYVNRELPDAQAGFRKGRGTRDQIDNICWIMEKAREFQKKIYFCFIDYAKAFDCVDHNSSVQFSCSVVSDSLWPHELQPARPPCASPTPGVHSNSRPSSQWCHPAISSSVVPFSSCPQSLPASGSFPVSQLCMRWPKYWSFSFSIIPSKEHQGLISFRMDWLDLFAVQIYFYWSIIALQCYVSFCCTMEWIRRMYTY